MHLQPPLCVHGYLALKGTSPLHRVFPRYTGCFPVTTGVSPRQRVNECHGGVARPRISATCGADEDASVCHSLGRLRHGLQGAEPSRRGCLRFSCAPYPQVCSCRTEIDPRSEGPERDPACPNHLNRTLRHYPKILRKMKKSVLASRREEASHGDLVVPALL